MVCDVLSAPPGGNCNTKVVSVAVNTSPDPTTAWKIYPISQINGTGNVFPDHPEIAVSSDKLLVTVNDMLDNASSPAYWVLRKSDFVSESTSYYIDNGPAPKLNGARACLYEITPVKSTNPNSTMYLVCEGATNSYLFKLNSTILPPNPLPSPILVTTMPSFSRTPPSVVLPGCSPTCPQPLKNNYYLSQDAYLADGTLWYGVDDQCTPNTGYACFHLVEINMTHPSTPVQSFDYGMSQQSVFLPRIIVDGEGDLGLIFGYSSTGLTGYPNLALTGQIPGDANGTLIQPVQIAQGLSYESDRLQDYFGISPDPSDPTLLWAVGGFWETNSTPGPNTNWAFEDSSFRVVGLGLSASSFVNDRGTSANTVSVTVQALGGFSGTVNLSSWTQPAGPTVSMNPSSPILAVGGSVGSLATVTTGYVDCRDYDCVNYFYLDVQAVFSSQALVLVIPFTVVYFDYQMPASLPMLSMYASYEYDQSASSSFSVSLVANSSWTNSSVAFSSSGQPGYMQVAFSPPSLIPTTTPTVVTVTFTIPAYNRITTTVTYSVALSGLGFGRGHTTSISIKVYPDCNRYTCWSAPTR